MRRSVLCVLRHIANGRSAPEAGDATEQPRRVWPYATIRPLLHDRAVVPIYPANDNVVRPSPVDDLDRSYASAPFVQDGTCPFYGFVLADRLTGVDPHATFVLTRVTREDDVDAVVTHLVLLRTRSRSYTRVHRMRLMYAPTPEGSSAGHTKMGWVLEGDVTPLV